MQTHRMHFTNTPLRRPNYRRWSANYGRLPARG